MSPILRHLIWLDAQILRVVTLGNSRPGETISAAAWSLEGDGKWQGRLLRPLIDFIFRPVQRDHCAQAWLWQKHLYSKE